MCSSVQCAMQKKSVYCGAMSCLAHVEQGPVPHHPGNHPPLCLATENSVCLQLLRKMNLDSIVDIHEQPNPESADTGHCMCILFLISHLVMSRPLLRLMVGEYWFRLSRLSMMVIGSFASYTKTKSVESAVWCLLTLDDGVIFFTGSELLFSLFEQQ